MDMLKADYESLYGKDTERYRNTVNYCKGTKRALFAFESVRCAWKRVVHVPKDGRDDAVH